MTREEAIKAFAGKMNYPMAEYYNETVSRITPMIDGFVALGMLKLDEPKNDLGKTYECLNGKHLSYSASGRQHVYVLGPTDIGSIIDALHGAGLRIIER